MTKTAELTTETPLFTAIGQPVLADGRGLRRIARALHWALVYRRECHLSLACGSDGWDDYPALPCAGVADTRAVGTLDAIATGTPRTVIDTDLWIDPDTAALGSLVLGAVAYVATGGNTLRVTFTLTGGLGTSTDTIDFTIVDSAPAVDLEKTVTRALAALTAGDEWVRLEVSIQRVAGVATNNELRNLRVQETELSIGSVPDPEDS
jgi:hypothetical protein